MARLRLALITLLSGLAFVAPARAADVIYYSPTANVFGWCAGYGSARAHDCAAGWCADNGASDCVAVLECRSGWGAVALAWDPWVAVGASCGLGDAKSARTAALAACILAARTLCWTRATFDENGNNASTDDNLAFDMAHHTQAVLSIAGYEPGTVDGRMGPATREAIRQFQHDIGIAETGETDNSLFLRLFDAAQGHSHIAEAFAESYGEKLAAVADLVYAAAASSREATTFDEDLADRNEAERLLALATLLTARGTDCMPTATAATLVGAMWSITCPGGDYTFVMGEFGTFTMSQ